MLAWAGSLVLALLLLVRADAPQAQQTRRTLALLPVMVHSSESPEYLRKGLSDMLASRFEQAGMFRVIRVEDPKKATTNLERALVYGREADADFVLFGSFTRFGAGASLDMQAAATAPGQEGETLREIFVHSGSIGDVIPDLEELVGKVGRFAAPDYRPPVAAGAASAVDGGPAGTTLAELLERVEVLEQEMRSLKGAPAGAK